MSENPQFLENQDRWSLCIPQNCFSILGIHLCVILLFAFKDSDFVKLHVDLLILSDRNSDKLSSRKDNSKSYCFVLF